MGLRTVMGGVYKHATDIHIHNISYYQWRIYFYMQRGISVYHIVDHSISLIIYGGMYL